jgi:hypothetical protein
MFRETDPAPVHGQVAALSLHRGHGAVVGSVNELVVANVMDHSLI